MPMPKRSPPQDRAQAPELPEGLELRVAAIERTAAHGDLDAFSWFWLVTLGVALPAGLLLIGTWI